MLVRLLRTFLSRYRGALLFVVLLQFVQAIAALYLPRMNAEVIDKGILRNDHGFIVSTGGVMLLITLLQVICSVGAVYFGARAAMGLGRDVRSAVFHTVGGFSTREVEQFGAPSLITRITNDVQQVQLLVLMICTLLIAAPITAVGGTWMALREDVGLSAILAVSLPVMLVVIILVIRQMVPQYRRMQELIDVVNRVLREQLMGIRVIRAFVREPSEERRFGRANDELTATSLTAGRLMATMFPSVMLIVNLSSAAVIWFGAKRIGSGHLRIGELIAFLTYLALILMAAMFATFIAVLWPRSAVCAERIMEVLDTPSSVRAADDATSVVAGSATVEFRDVGFHYPGADFPVLDDISFRSGPGETTAIIGSTGAGKSTLLNLVPRLFDASSGAVLVDGVDVRRLEPEALWQRIGFVPQKPYLFSGTVASNLRYAKPAATDDELWAALDIAQATEFVSRMPGQLEAVITQGGTNVSGGQRQRLAIARALVRRPEIYLFDDSFSALDLATDSRLRAALGPITRASTVIVVAQRVSTILQADRIIVLEDGRIVGTGTHRELLDTCETYQEIVSSQLSAEEARA
jgi:ATP-binding cassette subfamily B protein